MATKLLIFLLLAVPTYAATVTAYCHCAKCCGTAGKLTAAGTIPKPRHTIAAPRNVPLGTRVKIGNIVYTVEDRLHTKYPNRWDIFVSSHKQALKFGKQKLNPTILQ